MKKVFLLFLVPLCLGLMGMESCFPGDGYPNPDAFGVSGHGPALSYTDNGDGTFTDNVTKWRWEIKTDDDSVHDVDNTYQWSDTGTDPDGSLFDVFLHTLNNTCDGEGVTDCDGDQDCAAGEKCGFAGFRDWCIPNVKRLQSIVDYSTCNGCDSDTAASSVPGETFGSSYWSSTTLAGNTSNAWFVNFNNGPVDFNDKDRDFRARAVRPCE
ncbi:MAG: DUF1566 domain-containing protein [Thermodesulfobacteriota bacterium]